MAEARWEVVNRGGVLGCYRWRWVARLVAGLSDEHWPPYVRERTD